MRRTFLVRRIKGFCCRLAVALIIFVAVLGVSGLGGSAGQTTRHGVNYLLTKDYDLGRYKKKIEEVIKQVPDLTALNKKRPLDVEVNAPGKLPDLPVSGKLVRGFGWQNDANNWPRYHGGIELSVAKGALVRAVLPGKIVLVETDKTLGKIVVIEHDHDCATLYGRLGDVGVKPVQEVAQGQVIGSTADTLFHFQLREGERLVDPISRLQQ